ncbi:hypothetical protein P3T73_10090 [Kiritimatiellota bacterium B12222]|nr:hypothetical protein P3T73_10090 [Kiritimatiellota bacterium B12222]
MHKSLIALLVFLALRSNFSSAQETGQSAMPLDTWFRISEGENWNTNLQITVSKNHIWLKSSTKVVSQSISETDYRLITDAAVKMVTNGIKSTQQAPQDHKCYLRVWDKKGQTTTKWTGEITDTKIIMTMINSLMGEKTIEEFVARRTSSEPKIELPERIKALRCTEKGSLNRYPVKTYNESSGEEMITLCAYPQKQDQGLR